MQSKLSTAAYYENTLHKEVKHIVMVPKIKEREKVRQTIVCKESKKKSISSATDK